MEEIDLVNKIGRAFAKFRIGILRAIFVLVIAGSIAEENYSNAPSSLGLELETQAERLENEWSLDTYKQAVNFYKDAAEAWSSEEEPAAEIRCLNRAAQLSLLLSDNPTSESFFLQSLRIARTNRLIDEEVETLALLSLFYHHVGNSANSKKYSDLGSLLVESASRPTSRATAFLALEPTPTITRRSQEPVSFLKGQNKRPGQPTIRNSIHKFWCF